MKNVRIGAASLNQIPMDWEGNARRILEVYEEARAEGIEFLCLPELCISGYGCEDMFHSPHVQEKALEMLHYISRKVEFPTLMVGLPVRRGNAIYNCVAVIQYGKVMGIVPKQSLAKDGVHYEPRWFKPWPQGKVKTLETRHQKVPFGDLVFETRNKIRFGFEICEDAWVADRPGSRLSKRGVDIIFNPSASHFAFGKQNIRRRFVTEGSRAFSTAYVYANLLGNESGRIIFDGSTIIANGGEILQEGPRFSFKEKTLIQADIDLDVLNIQKTTREGFRPEDEIDGDVVEIAGSMFDTKPHPMPRNIEEWEKETKTWVKGEEFTRAIALGLFDYLRKTGVNGFTVSLSGGADSSAVAILVAEMVRLAKKELTKKDLPNIPGGFEIQNLLTCAYQATRNSSETTRDAAQSVAEDVGAKYLHLDVDAIVEAYKEEIGTALGLDWDWEDHDIALQNIQARGRAPSIWMISNIEHKILLATSNRSEAAVGYATMDGDTAGGISPIAGIDKAFLRKWLRWKVNSYPSLQKIIDQKPTAELRPSEEDQTDEDDLMPYPVLDMIEEQAIRDKKSPKEVFDVVRLRFPKYGHNQTIDWIVKFFTLWSRNQWKRERYAPSFHVDDKNLDPKTWCRFPILSSGYREELENLLKEKKDEV